MSISLQIKPTGGLSVAQFPVDVDATATVAELKEQIAATVGIPKSHIRLVCAGRVWNDPQTVGSYGAQSGAVVHCLNNPPRESPAAAQQTLQPADPMAQMMGPPPAANTGDPLQDMMAQSQRMMQENPDMMRQMMSSPMVQQMMSNPDTVRAMMQMNPQLNRLMEERPEIARILEDPETLRQSMQMATNPELMREMTRNADRAIGNLDAMPGGHNALVRAHEEFADPLYNAMTNSADGAGGSAATAAYAQQTAGNPNSQALPNPWGAPAPAPTPTPAPAQTPAPTTGTAPSATPPMQPFGAPQAPAAGMGMQQPQGANPMAAMMQQMMQQQQQSQGASPMMQQPQGANPMAAMMQQMASNPQMMQQVMQMMQNPQMMQQMMQMRQAMGMGAPGGGMFGNFGAPGAPGMGMGMGMGMPGGAMPTPEAAQPVSEEALRARFSTQLAHLVAMGFTNESRCLEVLRLHDGRVDAAIDVLLSEA